MSVPGTPWYGATRLSWNAPACIRPSNRFCRLGEISSGCSDGWMIARSRCGGAKRADEIEPELFFRDRTATCRRGSRGLTRLGSAPMKVGVITMRPSTHDRVHAEVMTVDLPTPRLARVRRSEHRHEVRPFAERVVVARQLGDELVDAHDRTGVVVPARRHGGSDDVERKVAHRLGQVFEHDAVTEVVHVDVDPHPPFRGVHRKGRLRALVGSQRLQERTDRIGDRSRCRPCDRRVSADRCEQLHRS